MAYPPTIPPNTRANTTDMVDAHASDHNALANAINALPWGRVASATSTATPTIGTTQVDIVSVTFNAVANRRYRVSASTMAVAVAGLNATFIITDGANAQLNGTVVTLATSYWGPGLVWVEIAPGAAGARTYKLRGVTNASTMTIQANAGSPSQISVDDIGL
jgi:hypothetical protein